MEITGSHWGGFRAWQDWRLDESKISWSENFSEGSLPDSLSEVSTQEHSD